MMNEPAQLHLDVEQLVQNNFSRNSLQEYWRSVDPDSDVQIISALPVTWTQAPVVRVFIQVKTQSGIEVFSLGWEGDELFDVTQWGHHSPHRVPLAIDPQDQNTLIICDRWTKRARRFQLREGSLVFERATASRVNKQQ